MAENENNNIHGDYNFEADEVQEAGEGNSLIVPPPEEEEEDNKTGERRSNKVFYPTDEMIERIRNMSCYGQKLTENDLEVFKKTMVHQTVENAFVDPVLGRELDVVKMMVTKRDMDSVLACDGTEGCQPKGAKVLMANGDWKNIESIQINDKVLSPQDDGNYKFATVIKLFKWVSPKTYDGYELHRQHKKLFSCSYNHKIPINHSRQQQSIVKSIEAEKLYAKGLWFARNTTCVLMPKVPAFMGAQNCEIEPYTLGVFIGNGHFRDTYTKRDGYRSRNLGITTQNPEIMQEISKVYTWMNEYIKYKNKPSTAYRFSITSKLAKQLIKYKYNGKNSGTKFIPKDALLSDETYRKRLLAGLIDTDGYLSKMQSYSYTTKSKQLAEDICFLIHSLGGRCAMRQITKSVKAYNFTGKYYCISFYLGDMDLPLQVKYKIRNKKFFYKQAARISICLKKRKSKIVYGFTLDSLSHKYISDNYVVHMNSGKSVLALSLAKYLDPTFTIDRVCFMLDEFLEQLRTVPKYSAVILDEAYASAGARASMTEINRALVSVAAEMRQRNLFVFLCLPSFFDLDRYFALWRCRALIHVYINKHKQRGNYVIFPPHEKKLLYLWGRKLYKYTWPKSPFDVCHFKNEYVVDELEYRAKKALAFRSRCLSDSERKYTNTMKHKERVGRLAYFMKDYLGVPMPAIKSIAGTDTLTYIDSIRGSEVQINVDKVAKEIADVIKQTEIKEVMVPDKYVEQTLYNIYEVIKDSSSSQRVKHDIKALIKNLPPAILKGFIKKHDEVARTIANGIIPTDQGSIRLEVADEGVSEQVSDDVPTGEEDVESR